MYINYYCKKQIRVTGKAWLQVSRICRAVECCTVCANAWPRESTVLVEKRSPLMRTRNGQVDEVFNVYLRLQQPSSVCLARLSVFLCL